jgi:hypothetical protein
MQHTLPAEAQQLVIRRVTPKTQTVDLHDNMVLRAETIEAVGDKATMEIQEIFQQNISKDDIEILKFELNQEIEHEKQAREAADDKLQQNLDSEKRARMGSDAQLKQDIKAEAQNRQNADTVLQQNINAEAQNRQNADTVLQQNINAEAQNRQNADTVLQQDINAEAQNRQNADTVLQQNINAEAQIRKSADNALRYEIDYLLRFIIAKLGPLDSVNIATEAGDIWVTESGARLIAFTV